MKKRIKDLTIGFIIGCAVMVTTPVLADSIIQKIDVALNTVNVEIDGEKLNADNILYNGTTYLPMRTVAEAVGKDVSWNQDTMTATISDKIIKIDSTIKIGNIIEKSDNLSDVTQIDEVKYQEFKNMFTIGEIINDVDIKENNSYLNRAIYNGSLNDTEFELWLLQYKAEIPTYLEKLFNEVYPTLDRTSVLGLEKIKENGQSYFVGYVKYDVYANKITVQGIK